MTSRGTFVINGAERVVVSQLHRSPGICFETFLSPERQGTPLRSASFLTAVLGWKFSSIRTTFFTFTLDRRRRRRKFLATTFLRAIGFSTDEDIVKEFFTIETLKLNEEMDEEALSSKVTFADMLDGEIIVCKAYEPLTIGVVRQLLALGQKTLKVVDTNEDEILIKSLKKDPATNEEEALKDIYKRLRPGDPPTVANARALLKRLFFDPKKYDLTRVGRYKINQKLGLKVDPERARDDPHDFFAL